MSNDDEDGEQSPSLLLMSRSSDPVTDDSNPSGDVETVDYNALTVAELKSLCRERGLTGYSSLAKAELIELLTGADGE